MAKMNYAYDPAKKVENQGCVSGGVKRPKKRRFKNAGQFWV